MRRVVQDLQARDREARAHETAHKTAGGRYAGGPSIWIYTTGPDGRQYAVGGEVQIDTAPVHGDPEATIEKMRTIQPAALAPAKPSAADRSVAAKASQVAIEARVEANRAAGGEDRNGDIPQSPGDLDRLSPDFAPLEQGLGSIPSRVA